MRDGPQKSLVDRKLEEDPMGGSYEHMGCFADHKADRVLGNMLRHADMTPLVSECFISYFGGVPLVSNAILLHTYISCHNLSAIYNTK